jgi:CHAT domain-containing protein/tetratricopeptide (TPR) repeat protein
MSESTDTAVRRLLLCWFAVIIATLLVPLSSSAQARAKSHMRQLTPSETSVLRTLAKEYFSALAANDWEAIAKLVSFQTPDMAERQDLIAGVLDHCEELGLIAFTIERISIDEITIPAGPKSEGEIRASVHVKVSIKAKDRRTGKQIDSLLNMNRVLECLNRVHNYAWDGEERDSILHHASSQGWPQSRDRRIIPIPRTKTWKILSDLPKPASVIESLKTATIEEIPSVLSLETDKGFYHVIKTLKKDGVELFHQRVGSASFDNLRLARQLEEEKERRANKRKATLYQQALEAAKRELTDWEKETVTNPDRVRFLQGSLFDGPHLRMRIADVHLKFGNYENALESFLEILESNDARTFEVMDLYSLGDRISDLYARKGEYSKAIDYRLQAISNPTDHPWVDRMAARDLSQIGDLYFLQSDYSNAIEYYLRSKKAFEILAAKAKVKPDNSMTGSREDEMASGMFMAVRSIARVHQWRGESDAIQTLLTSTAQEFKSLGQIENAGLQLLELGLAQLRMNQNEVALETMQTAVQVLESPNNKSKDSTSLIVVYQFLIGTLYLSQGHNDLALRALLKAEATMATVRDKDSELFGKLIPLMIGAIYSIQGDESLDDAISENFRENFRSNFREDLEAVWQRGGSVSVTLVRLGDLYRRPREIALALDCYLKALTLTDHSSERLLVLDRLVEVGDELLGDNDGEKALIAFEKALPIATERCCTNTIRLDDFTWGEDLQLRGNSPFNSDYVDPLLREVLDRERDFKWDRDDENPYSPAHILIGMGEAHKNARHYSKALTTLQQSLALPQNRSHLDSARAFLMLAEIYRAQNEIDKSTDFAGIAVAHARQADDNDLVVKTNTIYGQNLRRLNQLDKAALAFEEAKGVIEVMLSRAAGGKQERQFLFKDRLTPYYGLVEVFLAQGRTLDALRMAESTKARTLLQSMSPDPLDLDKTMTHIELQREAALSRQVKLLTQQLHQQQNPIRKEELSDSLAKARLEYRVFRLRTYASHMENQKRALGPPAGLDPGEYPIPDHDTAFLEYFVAEDRVYLFVITSDYNLRVSIKSFTLPIAKETLTLKIDQFRNLIDRRSNNFRVAASELFTLLVEPALSEIADKSNLVIVPDAVLWNLPFQALQTPTGHYLIEGSAVSYAPSLEVLRRMIARRAKENQQRPSLNGAIPSSTNVPVLLAVGNPSSAKSPSASMQRTLKRNSCSTRNALHPIPEAEREVSEIVKLYGGERTGSTSYIRTKATEGLVKGQAGRYRVLHLATHGVLDNDHPLDSYIVLAQERAGQYGTLSAREMMALTLRADLVVLSACETAQGRVGEGEGMIGMTWALAAAGAPTIVASQWQVNSCSTTELMIEFHRRFKGRVLTSDKTIGASEALRRAALEVMKQEGYQHPFYWAGFIVIGDSQ